jgi:SPASM domain peptide maturase of grasp-with-spasm system
MKNKYFKMHSSCLPVKGINQGCIYDLRRGSLYKVPNDILDILENYSNKKIEVLFDDYKEQIEIIKKYFDFFIENEVIFFTDVLKNFPEIKKTFRKPFLLDMVFLEIDNYDSKKREFFEKELISEIGCKELILIFKEKNATELRGILTELDKSKIQSTICFIDYKQFDLNLFNEISYFLRLRQVHIYNSPSNNHENDSILFYSNKTLEELLNQKITSKNDFIPNLDSFLESQKFNLFYNRRVYIDNENNVKHAINEIETYGNISDSTVFDIVSLPSFKKLWNIAKDEITVCKDCEFRYICPDNRIPVFDKKTENYYHIEECNYSPYTNQWK